MLDRPLSPFARFAWAVLAYTVFVILWGAFVRATGSGAGCGDHWPTCNGEIVPRAPQMETVIEFGHRLTSGLAGILSLILPVWAWRAFPKGHRVRKAALGSFAFMMIEAGIGAGLVLLEHVAYNVSVARGYWMAAHLVNTFILVGWLLATAYWASGGAAVRFKGQGRMGTALLVAILGTMVLGASGSVAALGDTLTLGGGLDPESDPVVGTLVNLRIFHPLIGCLVLFLVGWAVWQAEQDDRPGLAMGRWALGLFLAQMAIGVVNVQLLAPVWLQLVHLAMTNAIWIALLLFAAQSLQVREPKHRLEPVAA
jgi:heme A synthase